MQGGFKEFTRLAEVLAGFGPRFQDATEFIRGCADRISRGDAVMVAGGDLLQPRLFPENRTAPLATIVLRAGTTHALKCYDIIVLEFPDKRLGVMGQKRTVDRGLYHAIQ